MCIYTHLYEIISILRCFPAIWLLGRDFVQDQPLKWDMPPAMASISVSSMEAPAVGASPAAWKGETLSVVLPCAYEGEYASRTVESVSCLGDFC